MATLSSLPRGFLSVAAHRLLERRLPSFSVARLRAGSLCSTLPGPVRSRAALAVLAISLALGGVLAAFADWAAAATQAGKSFPLIKLAVDATEAPRRIFHAHLVIPAPPGPLTLLYPKWIPGEHGPTGPITDLAGLRISSGGKPLPWQRDSVDMYAFHCDVPPGTGSVDVSLDFLSEVKPQGFSSGASSTSSIAVVSWNQMLLYPKGSHADDLIYAATLRLPPGWKHGTALPLANGAGEELEFEPVSLTTLVDSPVLAGQFYRSVPLTSAPAPIHEIDMAGDSPAALDMNTELIADYTRLIAEASSLFGARHYRNYHFLLSLSENVAHFGLEHHESSDDRTWERALIDEERRKLMAGLLPHEFVHSWNGKYRRPAGLIIPDFSEPMKTDLLWVYEGLTTYLGNVLSARCGLRSPELFREDLALSAAALDYRAGRTWRPLLDTAIAAQLLYGSSEAWRNWRRGTDFYPEGDLIWLEADVIIRQQTKGRRSLDNFCRRFHGGESGPPAVKPYTYEDIVAALNDTAPYDWKSFLDSRLTETRPHPPLGGIEAGGWRLVYSEAVPDLLKAAEEVRKEVDVSFSIGLRMKEDGSIIDVVPGLASARAGLAPGMTLVAVNGRTFSGKSLRDTLKASKNASEPLELLVKNGEFYKSYRLDYHGGERYPHLERDTGRSDLLSEIIKPLVPPPASPPRGKP